MTRKGKEQGASVGKEVRETATLGVLYAESGKGRRQRRKLQPKWAGMWAVASSRERAASSEWRLCKHLRAIHFCGSMNKRHPESRRRGIVTEREPRLRL